MLSIFGDTKMRDNQKILLKHICTLPTELPRELLEATEDNWRVGLNLADFYLRRIPTRDLFFDDLFFDGIFNRGYQGQEVVFLTTPSVSFAYDPTTGREIANTMEGYGVTDRRALIYQWISMLKMDVDYLRSERSEDPLDMALLDMRANFVNTLESKFRH